MRDEREAFEAHITRFFSTPEAGPFSPEKMFYRIEGGRYFKGWLQSQWEGWQARAAAEYPAGVKVDAEPVAEMIACEHTGISVREIDGRWKFLRPGDKLYAEAAKPRTSGVMEVDDQTQGDKSG